MRYSAPRSSVFWACVWLAVVLVGVKMRYVARPGDWSLFAAKAYLWELCLASAADVLFVLGLGVVGSIALWLTARSGRLHALAWWSMVALCFACAAYAVASVKMFEYLRMPLTYRLLHLGSDLKNMESSVSTFATRGIVTALVVVPLAYLALVLASERWLRFRRTRAVRVVQGVLLVGLVIVCWRARAEAEATWRWRHEDRRIAVSAHYALAASFVREWVGGADVVRLEETFPAEYLADFAPLGEAGGAGAPTPGVRRGPKSVIIVVLESVGTQYLSVYGGKHPTTPRLEREARHSLVFDNFYAHVTNTANSLVAMTLSQYPPRTWRHGTEENPAMPGTTAAAVLKPLGYRTAFISGGDNQFAKQDEFLRNRGFDEVWDYRESGCALRPEFSWGVRDRCMVDMVLRWIDGGRRTGVSDPPFYVMAWTQGTHHPYEPLPERSIDFVPGAAAAPGNLEQYLNALAEVDRQLGRLFDGLRERGLEDEVMVVVTGDHGEAFGEPHGNWGHTGRVYEEDVRVPLVVWSPGLSKAPDVHPGFQSHVIGAHVDLSPTVLDLLGVRSPSTWQGRSLLSEGRRDRAYFFGMLDSVLLGVREGGYKYIYDAASGREQLFDLRVDPREQENVAGRHPEEARAMRRRVAAWVAGRKGE